MKNQEKNYDDIKPLMDEFLNRKRIFGMLLWSSFTLAALYAAMWGFMFLLVEITNAL